jgi:receptor protein-tyrosine kinase/non-specific protein-tyrosine kinase
MSRIEKAMEKAAQLRQGNVSAPEARQETPGYQVAHKPPSPDTVMEKVTSGSPYLVNMNDPHSPNAEEFRKMKSALVKLTRGDTFKNTIMVTSALPHEGKSITALNLAVSLAQEFDHTVLLVDADLRRPSINRYLNIDHEPGFSDCLLGEADISEAIIGTGIGRLSVITSGRIIANPVELFTSQRIHTLIDEMKHRYPDRYIIFDTPPVLPFAETRTLAHLVDGVLFVVKERLASQENIREAIDALKGCELLGMVYNDAILDYHDERYSYFRSYADMKP